MANTYTERPEITWTPGGDIAPYRFCKASTTARTAVQCDTQGEDATAGVSGSSMAVAPGTAGADTTIHASTTYKNALRIKSSGIVEVEVGAGTITAGSKVMTDTAGKAISFSGNATFSGSSYSLGTILDTTPVGAIAKIAFHRQYQSTV